MIDTRKGTELGLLPGNLFQPHHPMGLFCTLKKTSHPTIAIYAIRRAKLSCTPQKDYLSGNTVQSIRHTRHFYAS